MFIVFDQYRKYVFLSILVEEKLPEDETQRLIRQHPVLSKQPANDDGPVPKKSKKFQYLYCAV